MTTVPALVIASLIYVSTASLVAQTGRLEESKRLGFALLKDGKYDRAAAKLEEAYEVDKSDALVNEGLAVAYMNGDDRKNNPDLHNRAFAILEKSLASGGKASLLVYLALGNSLFASIGSPTNVCAGQLILQPGRLAFVCEKGEKPAQNSFDFTRAQITEVGERFNRGKGMFFVRAGKRTYNFVPANWEQKHSQFFLDLAAKYLEIQNLKQ